MNKKQKLTYTNLPIISKKKIHKNEDKDNKNTKLITVITIIFIIFMLLFCGYSMAKIIEQIVINVDAQVAEPILVIENDPSLDITAKNDYGVYSFKIKNFDEKNKLTETDLKYYIEVLTNLDEAINIELYENENKINLDNNKTGFIEISKDKKEKREYKIKVTYDKSKSDSTADIMEKIQVKVHTEQMKV